jgi:phenol 2-monooxygenase
MNKATFSWPLCTIDPGERLPDSTVHRVGTNDPTRLHTVFQNNAQFHVIVLTGNPFRPQALRNYHAFYVHSAREGSIKRYKRALRFITIIAGHDIGTTEILQGLPPLGIAYFDPLRKAHEAYGVDTSSGAVIVIRPDGFLGTAIRLGADSWKDIDSYFDGFLIRNERNSD